MTPMATSGGGRIKGRKLRSLSHRVRSNRDMDETLFQQLLKAPQPAPSSPPAEPSNSGATPLPQTPQAQPAPPPTPAPSDLPAASAAAPQEPSSGGATPLDPYTWQPRGGDSPARHGHYGRRSAGNL